MKDQIDSRPNENSVAEFTQLNEAYRALDRSPQAAVRSLAALADRGSPMAMLYLGYAYRNGIGVEKDADGAEAWYRKAAEAGLARANYHLGRLYLDCERYEDAKREFERASSGGFAPGDHFLGRMYYFGLGVSVDQPRARELLRAAARWGCIFAKALLATDRMRSAANPLFVVSGVLLKAWCYVEAIWIFCVDGYSSDCFR
jgi:TPR repeat protein